MLKKAYRRPMIKKVDFQYDVQVTAESGGYADCDHASTKKTGRKMGTSAECAWCNDETIWVGSTDPFVLLGL